MITAEIIPFPLCSRRDMVQRQARRAAELNPSASERHIAYQIEIQRKAMRRKGIDESLISRELSCFETAIRALLMRSASGGAQ